MLSVRARVAILVSTAAVVATVAIRLRLSSSPEWIMTTEEIMATPISVTLRREQAAGAAIVFDVFRDVDAVMSEWKPTSPLSQVNREAGRAAVAVPGDLRALLRRGVEIGDRTGGAFDITWAALWGLWDFRAAIPRLPDPAEVERRAALVDWRRVVIDDDAGTVELPVAGMMVGLGGIAKGYALDRAAAALREAGVDDFLIAGGGQMMAGGRRDGRPWRIGIRDPRGRPEDWFAFMDASNVSTSTSGDYESYFVIDGRRYHHILDPDTGWPAAPDDPLIGVTVASADATLADALSTAMMVLGRARALELAARTPGVEAVLVDARGHVDVTGGLAGKVEMVRLPGAGGGE